ATQNPIDMEGTYPLPEAQLDRFMLKIIVSAPPADEIVAILDRTTGMAAPSPDAVANAARIEQLKGLVRQVPAASHVTGYVARLVAAMHPAATDATPLVKQYLRFGPSPRGAQAVMMAAKVSALRDGRANVAFEDIKRVAHAALRHRLIRNFEGQAKEIAPDEIISEVLQAIPE
ncbi:MAG: MoxR family ATPase, partial [Phycisphaerae bacterium]|nr:MoxR family ATPase [Phycisphaerae bacterium]